MKLRIGIIGFGLVLFAFAGTASAGTTGNGWKTADNQAASSASAKGSDNKGGGRCRSEADIVGTAVDYCESQLKCSAMSPPKTTTCDGKPGRWVCTCK